MLQQLAATAKGDPVLERRGRYLSTVFLWSIGDEGFVVKISDGQIQRVDPVSRVMPQYEFRVSADRHSWDMLWSNPPVPGWHDILALMRRRKLHIEGNLHPFMTHLLYFKRLLVLPSAFGVSS
ncbi:MAG: hypothetical protein WAV72_02955 [Bradyrhizobium sp.]